MFTQSCDPAGAVAKRNAALKAERPIADGALVRSLVHQFFNLKLSVTECLSEHSCGPRDVFALEPFNLIAET